MAKGKVKVEVEVNNKTMPKPCPCSTGLIYRQKGEVYGPHGVHCVVAEPVHILGKTYSKEFFVCSNHFKWYVKNNYKLRQLTAEEVEFVNKQMEEEREEKRTK